jgi:hypothetical protein
MGALLAGIFILINIVAEKMHLWSGVAWIIAAGIILAMMINGYVLGDKFNILSAFSLSCLLPGIPL